MMLDHVTGLDPPNVKTRAAEGIDAASSLASGYYWIWWIVLISTWTVVDNLIFRSKIVENLAVVSYDTDNLYLAPYDWRLSYYNLEERDGYFSKLKSTIEFLRYIYLVSNDYTNINTFPAQETSEEENCGCCTLYGMYCAL